MRKKIITGLVALALLVTAGIGVMESKKNELVLNDLALANVEALAFGEEDPEKCPYGHVPDRYITTSGPETAVYSSNSSGEITVGGNIIAGYQKNTSVTITVEVFNCDGIQEGACCDQDKVGTFIV